MAPISFYFYPLTISALIFSLSHASPQGHRSLQKRGLVVPNTLPTNWTYEGCYNDSTANRALKGGYYADSAAMTDESCIAYCSSNNYGIAGTEYSQECYCGDALESNSIAAPAGDCNMACSGNSTEVCGGSNRLNLFMNPSIVPVHDPGPNGWTLIGCFTDQGTRTLSTGYATAGGAGSMTVALCVAVCGQNNLKYAGVEYADECYCGNSFSGGNGLAPDGFAMCDMPCSGNSSEFCGGPYRLDMYQAPGTGAIPVTPSSPFSSSSTVSSSKAPSSTIVSSQTSAAISSSTAALRASSLSSSAATKISSAASTTKASSTIASSTSPSSTAYSSTYSSLKSSSSVISSSAAPSSSKVSSSTASSLQSSSSMAASSVASSVALSTSKLSSSTVSSLKASSSMAASSVVSSASTISSLTASSLKTSVSTSASSTAASSTNVASSTIISTKISSSVTSSSIASAASSSVISSAVSKTVSSSASAISSSITSAATSSIASSIASLTSTAPATSTSTAGGLPSGWAYKGCYIDNADGRVLPFQEPDNSTLTVESCVNNCYELGYSVAGMEYSVQCFCGDAIYSGGALASSDSDCDMACGGNPSEECGAGNFLSIYSNGTLTLYQPAVAQTSGLPGSWTYSGCYNEEANGVKVFPHKIVNEYNNSATTCLSLCSEYGYPVGGMEYGDECYCGDPINLTNANSTKQPDSVCNMACSGDPRYLCGAGNLLSVYTWTGTPLYTWHTPSGGAAGEYELLIGGVVVPLITSQTITGKVTFLEKHGTGAPNSTGAYELTVSAVNNFTAAWRTMNGLKTDVFCSAGLTLPDRVGRQINIGGWSLTSTFGVRLYWPGGPTNDWQENVNELTLQNGRWYPSAMIMATGMILVVGGESGSNGPPVPTLELLPNPNNNPVVYLDFLNRTDPWNLYPFLAVLPSGGVFIAYYNEARILDENTFATTKTLPNIPGAVDNFLGGRTYPLEGTAVLMPQYAPYSAPLTVLICGGSTPYAGVALDNCVSLQPEVATLSSNWTIERMPSPRVMPCISTLPDGTYLILNGALAGVAGFGLASTPNLNALLYDPSQPVGSRISIMASTIVARLYHSEAILLQDGRVMVSGSDPEDNINPEEYRVEVFMPPYLLSGLPQPAYTIQNTDWTYGATVTITITSGSTANLRVSLLGAESSTHGNSMGQRILFPAVSCAGTTCTITAPPNSHVCPPGWFQLFVLDGPTPSHSTYVRIGGDLASLGNWPPYPDFDTPGVGAV